MVSHGQGALVRRLLEDLARPRAWRLDVVLTINIPEDEAYVDDVRTIPITVLRNPAPKGFGANHNAAFRVARGDIFIVANPDLLLPAFDPTTLFETLRRPGAGVAGPRIITPAGEATDSPRRFPTVVSLAGRVLAGHKGAEYATVGDPFEVDWVGGMFMAFTRETYQRVRGFDERFFMYMEDVDLCRRLRDAGLGVWFDPRTSVVHDARRNNRRDARHLRWHLESLARYLFLRRVAPSWSDRR